MIILRYLSRELLQTTLAVTLVLMVVIMSGRFVKYLADAAAGKFDVAVLFTIMFYRIPGFLELIIPLGFLVAILMAYGRMYAEQEMTVLFSCGFSQQQLVAYSCLPALLIMLIVAACSLWLTPLGIQKTEQLLVQQKQRNELEVLKAGRFQTSANGKLVTYTEDQQQQQLSGVFIASSGVAKSDDVVTVRAETGQRIEHKEYQQRYLELNNGVRYQGRPGDADFQIIYFETYGQHLPAPQTSGLNATAIDAQTTWALLNNDRNDARAALQWRLSAPLLILILTLLGVTLSYTTPRRGRYVMLFPAIVIYLLYLVMLNAAREAIVDGQLAANLGLWSVHSIFFLLAFVLFFLRTGVIKRLLSTTSQA